MSWSPDSSTTGAAVTGFSAHSYTLVDDTPPVIHAKQKTCTALVGTQGTATANSASSPFTATFHKPPVLRPLPVANPVTGLRGALPTNQYKLIVRKGALAAAGVPSIVTARLFFDVPAGVESYSPDEIRAMVSFLVGLLTEESADLADTLITGVL